MHSINHSRFRRAVALGLVASLGSGLAAPALAARAGDTTAIYGHWLADRLADRAESRTDGSMERIAGSRFPTLRAYVVAFVGDLVREQGLAEASRILGEEPVGSEGRLAGLFMQGLRSLSADALPSAILLSGPDARVIPAERSAASPPPVSYAPRASAGPTCVRPAERPSAVAELCPASGGAQPLGP
jgi:hypothetical protein